MKRIIIYSFFQGVNIAPCEVDGKVTTKKFTIK